jgi:4-hydroxy-tetrahydrodipicolinate synthase
MKKINIEKLRGIWSAAPTPLTDNYEIDEISIERLVAHHNRLGINGIFLAGTCGEGPWLDDRRRATLLKSTIKHNQSKMLISIQATDNSAMRMLDNIKRFADLGADIAIVAPPFFSMKVSQEYLADMFLEIIDKSPLPMGFYHRGKNSSVHIEPNTLGKIIAHPNILIVKDSSCDIASQTVILETRNSREADTCFALNGDEFDCVNYLAAGYDGLLLGGASFNGYMARKIMNEVNCGNLEQANLLQERMNRMMFDVYGGKNITCWLAGQKQLMVELGVFSTNNTIIDYSLTSECHDAIRDVVIREREFLLP